MVRSTSCRILPHVRICWTRSSAAWPSPKYDARTVGIFLKACVPANSPRWRLWLTVASTAWFIRRQDLVYWTVIAKTESQGISMWELVMYKHTAKRAYFWCGAAVHQSTAMEALTMSSETTDRQQQALNPFNASLRTPGSQSNFQFGLLDVPLLDVFPTALQGQLS